MRALVIGLFTAALAVAGLLYAGNANHSPVPWVNHDVVYHSYLGFAMHEGARLYVDLKEDNPPGSPLLLGALAQIGDRLGVHDFLMPHLFILLLGLAGLGLIANTLSGTEDRWRFAICASAYLLVVIRGNFANNLFPWTPHLPYDFGQREHQFALVFVPYVIQRLSGRPLPRAWLLWPFLVGYIGLFKPFWPPMILLVEGVYSARDWRRRWSELLSLGAGMAGVFLWLAVRAPASLRAFLAENVPMYLRGSYTYYDTSLAQFAASSLHAQMVAAGLVLLVSGVAVWRLRLLPGRDVVVLVALSAAAYLSVLHQHKFWSYHAMVYFGTTVTSIGLLLGTLVVRLPRPRWRSVASALAIGLALVATASTLRGTLEMFQVLPPLGSELVPLIRSYPRVMFFSMSVTTTYAPMLLRKPPVGPWTVLVDLPEILALTDETERDRRLASYSKGMSRDIDRLLPDLLVFSPETSALPQATTLHGLFESFGVVPRTDFTRLSSDELRALDPRLADWCVYRRSRTARANT